MLKVSRDRAEQETPTDVVRHPIPRVGVALFDEARDSGWAKLAGGETFRFRAPQDLASDCIWVCQSEDWVFRDKHRGCSHLRMGDYISKLSYIASDLGFRVDGSGKFGARAREACEVLAPTIHRAVVIAAQAYGWSSPAQWLKEDSLMEDIRKFLGEVVPATAIKPWLRAPLQAAYQSYSSVATSGRPYGEASAVVTLRFNRVEHAQRVMATPVPEGAWTCTEASADSANLLDHVLSIDRPCLVNATVEFSAQDAEIAALCAYGSQPKRSVLRAWMSQPEIDWLSKFATIHVQSFWKAEHGRPVSPKLQLPAALTADPIFQLSVPVGLVAEAHWRALAKDYYKPSVEGRREFSPTAVWLRAADRALCFRLALAAHKAGFHVTGYGNGSVTVLCAPDRLPELLEFAQQNEVAHPVFQSIFQEFGLIHAS